MSTDPVRTSEVGEGEGNSFEAEVASDEPLTPAPPATESTGSVPEPAELAPDADPVEPAELEPDADPVEAEADAEVAALIEKASKADEYLALAQRTQADFENFRKRSIREAGAAQDRGIAKLAKELLVAVDNLDRALAHAPQPDGDAAATPETDSAAQLLSGVRLVHADVLAALARVGIEPFAPVGEPFDPQFHEAVAQQPFEGHAPGTVVEVYQLGYRLGEGVLRPARVMVAA